jgi:hypothetical protein
MENKLKRYIHVNDYIRWYCPTEKSGNVEFIDVIFYPEIDKLTTPFSIATEKYADYSFEESKIRSDYSDNDADPVHLKDVDHIIVVDGDEYIWNRDTSELNNAITSHTEKITGLDVDRSELIDPMEVDSLISDISDDVNEGEISYDQDMMEELISDLSIRDTDEIERELRIAQLRYDYYDNIAHSLNHKELEKFKESDTVYEFSESFLRKVEDYISDRDG